MKEDKMSKFKIDIGKGQKYTITQSIGDIKEGLLKNDLSRISAMRGEKGLHTGSFSETIGRHNKSFGTNKK